MLEITIALCKPSSVEDRPVFNLYKHELKVSTMYQKFSLLLLSLVHN